MSVGPKESIVQFLLHFLNLALFHLDYFMSIIDHGFPPGPNCHKQCCVSNFRKTKHIHPAVIFPQATPASDSVPLYHNAFKPVPEVTNMQLLPLISKQFAAKR